MIKTRTVKMPRGMMAVWIGCVLFLVGAVLMAYTDTRDQLVTGYSDGQKDSNSDRDATFALSGITFAVGILLIGVGTVFVSFFGNEDGWTEKYEDRTVEDAVDAAIKATVGKWNEMSKGMSKTAGGEAPKPKG